jgi:hypothetical protein
MPRAAQGVQVTQLLKQVGAQSRDRSGEELVITQAGDGHDGEKEIVAVARGGR